MSTMLNKPRFYWVLLIFLTGTAIGLLVSTLQRVPGYMDAAYYFVGGQRLAQGFGANELFLWNYLDDPAGLPHPAYTYWMPLPSLLAAAGMLLAGSADYFSARLFFVLLFALIPLLSALLAFRMTGELRHALFSAGLSLFPGYYLVFLTNTESFAPCMILGCLFFLTALAHPSRWQPLVLGSLAGLLHLSRADGILWLAAAVGMALKSSQDRNRVVTTFLGYCLVTFFWYARNFAEFGALFPPGGMRALWLLNYDQTFAFPADQLTVENWVSQGWQTIFFTRLEALGKNMLTLLGVQMMVFLLPLVGAGIWLLRSHKMVRFGVLMWLVIFLVLSVVFPFSGTRGAFFHSGAALQPFFWAVAGAGLDGVISIGVRKRGWHTGQAYPFLAAGLVALSAILSIVLINQRVIGSEPQKMVWQKNWDHYLEVEQNLDEMGLDKSLPVLINNPPLFFAVSGRPALVIPDGGTDTLAAVARRYGASLVVLEKDHVKGLQELYSNPKAQTVFEYRGKVDDTILFSITP